MASLETTSEVISSNKGWVGTILCIKLKIQGSECCESFIILLDFLFLLVKCRRPTSLQDRMRDSDDEDLHDRDYDVAALANYLSQAFR